MLLYGQIGIFKEGDVMIHYVQGDLFQSQAEALVNTINCVGTMGKGLALEFKKKFPDNFQAYKTACEKKKIHPGKMFTYSLDSLFGTQYIINFPTKNHWREKSKLSYIEEGLADLIRVITEEQIESIAIPPLGCGNGGLAWNTVKKMIEKYLDTISCEVYVYEPPTSFIELQNKITPSRALLLCAMEEYYELNPLDALSRLEVQKLAYFLQALGEPLRLTYEKGCCGPFAKKLNVVLNDFEDKGYIEDIIHDDSPEVHEIRLPLDKINEARNVLRNDVTRLERLRQLQELLSGFEDSYGLELLATVFWVVQEKPASIKTAEQVVYALQQWNQRKKMLFDAYAIKAAWNHLQKCGMIEKFSA